MDLMAGFKKDQTVQVLTARKEFGSSRCRRVAHLLGTHHIRVGFRDHEAQITEIYTIYEKVDRQDTEKGHEAGSLPPKLAGIQAHQSHRF
jgi:hypothetical protein